MIGLGERVETGIATEVFAGAVEDLVGDDCVADVGRVDPVSAEDAAVAASIGEAGERVGHREVGACAFERDAVLGGIRKQFVDFHFVQAGVLEGSLVDQVVVL